MPVPSVVAVDAVTSRHARRPGGTRLPRGTGRAGRSRQAFVRGTSLEGDTPFLEFVELLLMGDEHGRLRDKQHGQRGA